MASLKSIDAYVLLVHWLMHFSKYALYHFAIDIAFLSNSRISLITCSLSNHACEIGATKVAHSRRSVDDGTFPTQQATTCLRSEVNRKRRRLGENKTMAMAMTNKMRTRDKA
jgi:hypothetical protein